MRKCFTTLVFAILALAYSLGQTTDTTVVDPWPACQAYFDYYSNDSIMTFAEAYPYRFDDRSTGDVEFWNWDFGDGQTSNEQNPMHFFKQAGDTVIVCLTITTTDSCSSSYCISFIVGEAIKPYDCKTDFTIAVKESYPSIYNFIPDSVDYQASYFWDFGDGSYSSEIRPDHKYVYSGNYYVCLSLTTGNGCTAYECKNLQATGYNHECKAAWEAFSDIYLNQTGTGYKDTIISPIGRYYYFQDFSRGMVVAWNWDFGDGTVSKEQNPVHVYEQNGMYNVCLQIFTEDSCTSSYCDTLYVGVIPYCSLTGTVRDFSGLDGCGLVIELDNGEILEPAEIVPDFKLSVGQRVRLSYTELTDRASICMAGKIVRIDCIEELNNGYCQAAFTHYSLPWISSWPPLYQFDDISYGEVINRLWDFGDGTISNEYAPTHRYKYSGYYTVCLTITTSDWCTSTICETGFYEGTNPQPGLCSYFIKLNTEIILNGQTCNGTAEAILVDENGNEAEASAFLWSTGETSKAIENLCPGVLYSVIVTDTSGCAVSGSFSFGGTVAYHDTLFGNWYYQQEDLTFIFNVPVFSDSIYCGWDFGDGESANGASVNHTYNSDEARTVTLNVFDLKGNLIYTQQIQVSPGAPTNIRNLGNKEPEVYPVPVTDILYLKLVDGQQNPAKVEIYTTSGQTVVIKNIDLQELANPVQLNVSALSPGYYMGRLIFEDGTQQQFRFVK
jgi:PKD repeat protein